MYHKCKDRLNFYWHTIEIERVKKRTKNNLILNGTRGKRGIHLRKKSNIVV